MAIPIITGLLQAGLTTLANAFIKKGVQEVEAFVEEKTGIKLDSTSNQPLDPQTVAKLKTLELEHKETLLQMALDEKELDYDHTERMHEIYLQDLDSARNMNSDIQTSQHASKLAKWTPYILDIMIIVMLFVLAAALFFVEDMSSDKKELLLYVLGLFSGLATQVISFHRGSSAGSKEKAEQLRALMRK
jgi:hypothetical protein